MFSHHKCENMTNFTIIEHIDMGVMEFSKNVNLTILYKYCYFQLPLFLVIQISIGNDLTMCRSDRTPFSSGAIKSQALVQFLRNFVTNPDKVVKQF